MSETKPVEQVVKNGEGVRAKMRKVPSDKPFIIGLAFIFSLYLLLILGMLVADANYTSFADIAKTLENPNIQYSLKITMLSCFIATILSVIVAVPTGYLLARFRFPGKAALDALLDIPIILPPLVIGLSLLILFHKFSVFGTSIEEWCVIIFSGIYSFFSGKAPDFSVGVTYKVPAIILAQFSVSCAFAVRTMRNTFDQMSPRQEQVAMTLGCNRSQAFWLIAVPGAWRGILTAAALAWARALGEFGPILIFAGTTRGRTEVLSTSVFLEISIGNLEGAVAVSMIMVVIALAVLFLVRLIDGRKGGLYDIN
ncbi:molybdenum ABC transporter, permease protein [Lentisphaera araneosa HTCC2155]|uniref:Molybdenum ABC transporter, permease protein n=1 Tax=Lentisphaera araneosa HTCC2155 TaxID=313628 RepID=A6DJP9_9BACT|nr:ABC transporter permease [Lentisphaera araneosa]EDM28123.1 molybdenum ABC transporter, permease protein [Lentisphaera araneosa HTCC2155]